MAGIILNKFGGLIPKLDKRNLPHEGAQKAHNCNLYGGKLAPIDVTGPFNVLHDPDTGDMKSQIPDGNIISITEPATPSIAERINLFRPDDWAGWEIRVGMWVSYFDGYGNYQELDVSPSLVAGSGYWERTQEGFILRINSYAKTFTAQAGLYYDVYGVNFGITCPADTKYYGGPEATHTIPDTGYLDRSSPHWPIFSIPLTAPIDYSDYTDGSTVYTGERYQYGTLQLVDVNMPVPLPNVDMTDKLANRSVTLLSAGQVEFHFKANYQRNAQQFVSYVTTAVDQRVSEGYLNNLIILGAITSLQMKEIRYGASDLPNAGSIRVTNSSGNTDTFAYTSYSLAAGVYTFQGISHTLTYTYSADDAVVIMDTTSTGKEGPPSDISDLIVLEPNEILKLTVARPANYTRQNIYRAGTSQSFRLLADEVEADVYFDTFIDSLSDALPPYGNYPQATLASAKVGSIIVGGHTSIIADGDEIRPSEPYKQWVYPEEYAFPADATILAMVSFDSSFIVFTDTNSVTSEVGKVFLISGQNPKWLNRSEISGAKPLLNKRSVCKIDQTAFYASSDGMVAVGPGGMQVITEGLFTREEWLDYEPASMSAYTNDNSIFIIGLLATNPLNMRIDLGEGLATITTFDAWNSAEFDWKSKSFALDRPASWRNLQVIADGYPVELTIIGDGGNAEETVLVGSDKAMTWPRMQKCRNWEVQLKGRSTVQKVAIATNVQELNNE